MASTACYDWVGCSNLLKCNCCWSSISSISSRLIHQILPCMLKLVRIPLRHMYCCSVL